MFVRHYRWSVRLILVAWMSCFQILPLQAASPAIDNPKYVHELLSRMSQALRELNYQGLFTYEYGGSLDTLKISHSVSDGVEREYLSYLNGPEREFVRSGQHINCLPASDQLLRGLFISIGENSKKLNDHYHFFVRGKTRIAGREAVILQAEPKDHFRYGYTFGIDIETGLPLKSLLIDNKRRVLERFQFIELSIGKVAEDDLIPKDKNHRVVNHQLSECQSTVSSSPAKWQAEWLPKGFMFSGQRKTPALGDVLIFTDGFTTLSVFIDSESNQTPMKGKIQRGATVAVMSDIYRDKERFSVTVVGEIPLITAERIAASIKPVL